MVAVMVVSHNRAFNPFQLCPSFEGANVTVPHKEVAYEGCDEVRGIARKIGAVNTLSTRRNTRRMDITPMRKAFIKLFLPLERLKMLSYFRSRWNG